MKNFYEMTHKDLKDMSSDELIKLAQDYSVTDYAYKNILFDPEFDSIDDDIDIDVLRMSIANHIESFNEIVEYIKKEFDEEIVSIELGYGNINFVIETDLHNFHFNIRKDNLCDDLSMGVTFKNPRPDEDRDDRDRSKTISGKCIRIAKDEGYGDEVEYEIDFDEIYDFIADVIDYPERYL